MLLDYTVTLIKKKLTCVSDDFKTKKNKFEGKKIKKKKADKSLLLVCR